MTAGRTASAELQVITGSGPARLVLSTSEVKIGDAYFATAWVSYKETAAVLRQPGNGVIGVFPAGAAGSRWTQSWRTDLQGTTRHRHGADIEAYAPAELNVIQPSS